MDKYIKVSDAIDYFLKNVNWSDEDGYQIEDYDEKRKIYEELFDGIPATDVVERRKGIWLFNEHVGEYFCSECRRIETADEANKAPYCRWCGADMRE